VRRTEREGFTLGAIILNRTLDERTFKACASEFRRIPAHLDEISALRMALGGDDAGECGVNAVVQYLEDYRMAQLKAIARAARFASEIPPRIRLVLLPELEIGVRGLRGLATLASMLTDAAGGRRFLTKASAAIASRGRPERDGRRAAR